MSDIRFLHPEAAAAPMGPYSPGALGPGILFTAGQLPIDPATGQIVADDVREQARQCIRNIRAVLESAGLSLERVVKLSVFLRDMNDLSAVAEVREEFWRPPHPVSTTVQVSFLPNPRALVEIDAVAIP